MKLGSFDKDFYYEYFYYFYLHFSKILRKKIFEQKSLLKYQRFGRLLAVCKVKSVTRNKIKFAKLIKFYSALGSKEITIALLFFNKK